MRRVLIIGSEDHRTQSRELRIDSVPWSKVDAGFNILDYDTLVVNLLSLEAPDTVDWRAFARGLNRQTFLSFLNAEPRHGTAAIIGDPRFTYLSIAQISGHEVEARAEFLNWLPFDFNWDGNGGTGQHISDLEHKPKKFSEYIHSLGKWDYSLRRVEADPPRVDGGHEFRHEADVFSYCSTWSGSPVVFRLYWYIYARSQFPELSLGPIWFLPRGNLTQAETIEAALSVLDIETETPQPHWVEPLEAPGEAEIRIEMAGLREQIRPLAVAYEGAEERQKAARRFLGLLYEKQRPLEPLVRDAFASLGAEVEDPTRPDKEEGTLSVTIGERLHQGVLEVKSTRNETFDEQGLKQLEEWKLDAETQRGIEAKGIFIGNSAIEQEPSARPYPFDKGWAKAAAKRGTVAMTTTWLYQALALDTVGKLDRDAFWTAVFDTDGPVDSTEIAARYAATFPKDAAAQTPRLS